MIFSDFLLGSPEAETLTTNLTTTKTKKTKAANTLILPEGIVEFKDAKTIRDSWGALRNAHYYIL